MKNSLGSWKCNGEPDRSLAIFGSSAEKEKKKQFKNDEKDKNEEVKKAGEAGKNVFLNAKTHELTQGKPR